MPRAKETIFPFVVSLLLHQHAQGFIASLDSNVAECGLMKHLVMEAGFRRQRGQHGFELDDR